VQISVSVVAVVVKTERLALTVVVTLCQCGEIDVKEEQRVVITFCCKVDFSTTKTVELIQKAYGDAALSQTTIFEWHKQFRKGRESVKYDEHSGRPTTSVFDSRGTVHEQFVQEVCTVNAKYFKAVLDRLISRNRPVCPTLYRNRDFYSSCTTTSRRIRQQNFDSF